MSGIFGAFKDIYIRFMVWLGAEPPAGYEHLAGKSPQPPAPVKEPPPPKISEPVVKPEAPLEVAEPQPAPPLFEEPPAAEIIEPEPVIVPPAEITEPQPAPVPVEEPPAEVIEPEPIVVPPAEITEPQPAPVPVEEPPAEVIEPEPPLPAIEAVETVAPVQPSPDTGWLEAAPPLPEPVVDVEAPTQLPLAPDVAEEPAIVPDEAEISAEELMFRYEIQRGDTLNAIARRYGLTVRNLLEANQLEDPSRIFPGKKLVIPGYTLSNPELEPPPQPALRSLPAETDDLFVYTVAGGDTLNAIAKRYGITLVRLIEANDLGDPLRIYVGQKLVIPGLLEPAPPRLEFKTSPDFPPVGPLSAIRAAYLSYFAIGHTEVRRDILKLSETRELNAMVIDVKGDQGLLSYATKIPLAQEIEANRATVEDLKGFLASIKTLDVYSIGRVVVFKDSPLAHARPELAVKTAANTVWQDSNQSAWADPFCAEVWDYNIQIAIEAAELGFDEIQFDFVRFPTVSQAGVPCFSQQPTKDSRVAAISGFLSAARGQLAARQVKVSARVMGYTCWRQDDFVIGQKIERMAEYLDVLCPMLYPSTFDKGIPGYKIPVAHPYEVVHNSAKIAVQRVSNWACDVRPWLQDFQDYRFDKRTFGRAEIQAQIKGSFDAGCSGYMVWNPTGKYTADAYAPVTVE